MDTKYRVLLVKELKWYNICSSGFGSNIYLKGRWACLSTLWLDDGVAAVRREGIGILLNEKATLACGHMLRSLTHIPYSWKFSQVKTFTNFAVLPPSAKVLSAIAWPSP